MVEDESRPEETSEPLPEQLAELRNPNWVHMDVVEKDKLAWMTPAPVLGKPGKTHLIVVRIHKLRPRKDYHAKKQPSK